MPVIQHLYLDRQAAVHCHRSPSRFIVSFNLGGLRIPQDDGSQKARPVGGACLNPWIIAVQLGSSLPADTTTPRSSS